MQPVAGDIPLHAFHPFRHNQKTPCPEPMEITSNARQCCALALSASVQQSDLVASSFVEKFTVKIVCLEPSGNQEQNSSRSIRFVASKRAGMVSTLRLVPRWQIASIALQDHFPLSLQDSPLLLADSPPHLWSITQVYTFCTRVVSTTGTKFRDSVFVLVWNFGFPVPPRLSLLPAWVSSKICEWGWVFSASRFCQWVWKIWQH